MATATFDGDAGLERGCGCSGMGVLVSVPVALESIALALVWFGPGSSRLWALKALVVAVGGLLLVLGRFARIIAAVSKTSPIPVPIAALGPYVTIADACAGRITGIATLRGIAEVADDTDPNDLPRSPLSRTPSLWYELTVHRIEEVFSHQASRLAGPEEHWEQVHREARSVPFALRDQTGRIAVDPTGALIGAMQGEGRRADFGPDDLAVRSLENELRAAGFDVALPRRADDYSRTIGYAIDEEFLLPDWELTVIGRVQKRDGTPIVAREGRDDPFSIAVATDDDLVVGLRTLVNRVRIAAVLLPLTGAALVILGFWLVLTT